MILTLRTSRSLTAVPNGRKDYFQKRGIQFVNRMPLMNTFTFLTFTRPLAIPSDVSAALFKALICFRSHFIAEEGYSILTETSSHKVFLVSDNKNFLFIIIPDYNYSICKLQNLCTLPKLKFSKINFPLKTLEIGKCLLRQQNGSVLNVSPSYFLHISLNFRLRTLEPALLTAYPLT